MDRRPEEGAADEGGVSWREVALRRWPGVILATRGARRTVPTWRRDGTRPARDGSRGGRFATACPAYRAFGSRATTGWFRQRSTIRAERCMGRGRRRDERIFRPPGRWSRGARRPAATESPSRQIGIQPERGCHRAVTRLYPPLARKRDRDLGAGTARLLLSLAGFVKFRAPIDSVMDPGGQPRRPMDPFLSLRCGFGPLKGWKTRWLTRE
jgi:hypothetical protein